MAIPDEHLKVALRNPNLRPQFHDPAEAIPLYDELAGGPYELATMILGAVAAVAFRRDNQGKDCPNKAKPMPEDMAAWQKTGYALSAIAAEIQLAQTCCDIVLKWAGVDGRTPDDMRKAISVVHAVQWRLTSSIIDHRWSGVIDLSYRHVLDMDALWFLAGTICKERGDQWPRHPLEPSIHDWQRRRVRRLRGSTVTQAGTMIRRPEYATLIRLGFWRMTTTVDGEAFSATLPDAWAALGTDSEPQILAPETPPDLFWRGVRSLPRNWRLAMVEGMPGLLAHDVLLLLDIALSLDSPVPLPDRAGAQLLARSTDGRFRRVFDSDVERFKIARNALSLLRLWHGLDWIPLTDISPVPNEGLTIFGPPDWLVFAGRHNRYTLTTDGGRAGRARLAAGGRGAERLLSGLEYALFAASGQNGGNPFAEPETGKTGPGPELELTDAEVCKLLGETVDWNDRKERATAMKRLARRYERVEAAGFMLPNGTRSASAATGDSIEIVDILPGRAKRSRKLIVRVSKRGVESQRLAAEGQLRNTPLVDWIGLDGWRQQTWEDGAADLPERDEKGSFMPTPEPW